MTGCIGPTQNSVFGPGSTPARDIGAVFPPGKANHTFSGNGTGSIVFASCHCPDGYAGRAIAYISAWDKTISVSNN